MRSIGLQCVLALSLAACHPNAPASPAGGGDSSTGSDPSGGAGPTAGSVAEFQQCSKTADCVSGLECTEWGGRARSYCMRPCSGDADCAPGLCTLDVSSGLQRCTRQAAVYGICDMMFDSCGSGTFCFGSIPGAPWRCVPTCDPTDTTGTQCATVALPAGIVGEKPHCESVQLNAQGLSMGLCVAEVAVGQLCDQGALRCNYYGQRADTDPANGPSQPGYPDPGALACVPGPDGATRCLRWCSVDGGSTVSPCACPTTTDALCTDPTAGLAWQCHDWAGLAPFLAGARACAPVEDCSADPTVCADDGAWGLTTCGPTPFTDPSPISVCQ